MRKTVYLLRHAKAEPAGADGSDETRALTPEGEDAARRMGAYIRMSGIAPDLVLCSPATRTQQTCKHICPYLPKGSSRTEPGLYLATSGGLFHLLQQLPEEVTSVMLIGHNPGLPHLAELLCDRSRKGLWQDIAMKFPTAALAEIGCTTESWKTLSPGCGEATEFVRPKQLPKDLAVNG